MRVSALMLTLSLIFSNCLFGQIDISKYKIVSDKYLASKFNNKFKGKYIFESFFTTTEDSGNWHFLANEIINNTIDSFISMTFQYTFFSKKINFKIPFELTVNRDSTIDNTVDLFRYIPKCIISDSDCNLLTKNEAIQLAKKYKIKYSVDFDIVFCKPSDKSDYYWSIIGFATKLRGKSNERHTYKFTGSQERIINARTGELISWEDYIKQN